MKTQTTPQTHVEEEGDFNLIEIWLRFDLPRLIAGALAGLVAGAVALVFAAILCKVSGSREMLFPFKLGAAPILGADAMTLGMNVPAILIGFLVQEFIAMVMGMCYAHFTGTNRLDALLGAGFMWGTFSWIFVNNLFSKSFQPIYEQNLPAGAMFFILLVFGFSLSVVRVFDRMICGKAR